ncbi:MAG: hypothetical protein EOO22_08670 [Comamonadaceae bacterium]|nr:MAG: hypothetical protein EOO22_08670 [Comamonadaceae bacterium]
MFSKNKIGKRIDLRADQKLRRAADDIVHDTARKPINMVKLVANMGSKALGNEASLKYTKGSKKLRDEARAKQAKKTAADEATAAAAFAERERLLRTRQTAAEVPPTKAEVYEYFDESIQLTEREFNMVTMLVGDMKTAGDTDNEIRIEAAKLINYLLDKR